MLWLLVPILITVRRPDPLSSGLLGGPPPWDEGGEGGNILWMGADRGLSMGGNFRRRRRSTGPIPEAADEGVKFDGFEKFDGFWELAGLFEIGPEFVLGIGWSGWMICWSGSRAKIISTSGPQVLSRDLASSIVRPRRDLPLTLIISSPRRNRPSLKIEKKNFI